MNTGNKIRVLIADDMDIMRQAIDAFLARFVDIEVVGQSSQLETTLRLALELTPDVILMNDYLPPTTSAHATQFLRERNVASAILVISMHNEPQIIRHSLDHGANGFMNKDEIVDFLYDAIHQVHNKEQYLSPQAIAALTG